ncbi:enoyl-CoA hydratase-related protein [Candidatus Poriferisocius sp.]|uniref:enoyl-CoA hydratase-related protein n=1 Tax=Candidatus Poriferisocius sp. TaxID=3101276 RepID=UPI003B01B927
MSETPTTGIAILAEDRERVRYITLNRPERRNALTMAQLGQFFDALADADAAPDIGAIVIQGAGGSFCSGIDLDPAEIDLDYDSRSFEQELALVEPFRRFEEMWRLRTPTIASVHGYCLAVGTDIAFHADMTVCSEDAKFGYPIARSMASPSTHMWTYLAGPQWAKRLLLTGDMIDGTTAARAGFVLEAVPTGELADYTHALARRVATVPADISAANKAICNKVIELMGRTMAQELAREHNVIAHQSPAAQEFGRIIRTKGFKAALAWQSEQFG